MLRRSRNYRFADAILARSSWSRCNRRPIRGRLFHKRHAVDLSSRPFGVGRATMSGALQRLIVATGPRHLARRPRGGALLGRGSPPTPPAPGSSFRDGTCSGGRGDSAMEDATFLTNFANQVGSSSARRVPSVEDHARSGVVEPQDRCDLGYGGRRGPRRRRRDRRASEEREDGRANGGRDRRGVRGDRTPAEHRALRGTAGARRRLHRREGAPTSTNVEGVFAAGLSTGSIVSRDGSGWALRQRIGANASQAQATGRIGLPARESAAGLRRWNWHSRTACCVKIWIGRNTRGPTSEMDRRGCQANGSRPTPVLSTAGECACPAKFSPVVEEIGVRRERSSAREAEHRRQPRCDRRYGVMTARR